MRATNYKLVFLLFSILPGMPAFASSYATSGKDWAVNNAMDEWEAADSRHKAMIKEIPWPEVERKHFQIVKEEKRATSQNFDNAVRREEAQRGSKTPPTSKHQLKVGSEFFYAKYEEPDVMEQRGKMWGIEGVYTYRPGEEDLLNTSVLNTYALETTAAWGDFRYEAEADSQAGLQADKEDHLVEIRGILGREYVDENKDLFLFYSGLGFRYLNDDEDELVSYLRGSRIFGYERLSNYYYIPAGVNITRKWLDGSSINVSAEYDFFVYGKQTSYLSNADQFVDASQFSEDVVNEQHEGYGLRGAINLEKNMGLVNLFVEPFFRYWHIEDSDIDTVQALGSTGDYIEPENKTIEGGVKLGLRF